jgi:hypothetical protein
MVWAWLRIGEECPLDDGEDFIWQLGTSSWQLIYGLSDTQG